MQSITLYGAGGHCFAIVELVRSIYPDIDITIVDDSPTDSKILSIEVSKAVFPMEASNVCVVIGDNRIREKIVEKIEANFPTFVHSSVQKYPSVKIGKGTTVLPLSQLDADVTIGAFCIINNGAVISHNARIGDYVHIAVNATVSGNVSIGNGTLIGAGSIILPTISIGKNVIVGAGSVVTKDIPDNAVVAGNPSRIIRYNTYEE